MSNVIEKRPPRKAAKKRRNIMKRFLALLLAVIMVLGLAACGGSKTSTTTTPEPTPAAKKFIHGFDLDYPPYSFLNDDGTVGGFDVELAQAVCEYLGWEYEPLPFNWDAKDAELNAGSCDCIWSGFTVEGREDDYTWSIAYSNNDQMIMVPENSDIKTLEDLAGKVVGVQTATSAYDLLTDGDQVDLYKTFKKLEVYETYTIAFNDLQAGAIDAIAIDVTSGNFLMSNVSGYKFLDTVLGAETYAIGFRKGDTELCQQVNDALMALVENGTYDAIGQKYPDIYDYLCLGK